jgi:hypothetical protein
MCQHSIKINDFYINYLGFDERHGYLYEGNRRLFWLRAVDK